MAEKFTGHSFKLKSDEELMLAADDQFLPDIATVQKIKDAYEGTYATGSDETETGAGGVIFAVSELMVDFIAREPILNPPNINGEFDMEDEVVEIIYNWMQPDANFHRPSFKELMASTAREAILSGFICAERWYPELDPNDVRDSLMNGSSPSGDCQNIIIRPSEHWCINRSHNTGIILIAPFWYKLDISEDYEETDYLGPLHRDQVFYGALHKRTLTDYYGMSPFAPCVTEIINLGKAFRVAESIGIHLIKKINIFVLKTGFGFAPCVTEIINLGKAFRVAESIGRHVIKPLPMVGLQPGLGDTERQAAEDSVYDFLESQQDDEEYIALIVPGANTFDYFFPKGMKFEDVSGFISELQSQIFTWVGTPETLFHPSSSYATAAVQSQLFEQRMSWYRDIIWSWWEWHFRLILRDYGIEDWQFTPISIDWEVKKNDWQSIEDEKEGQTKSSGAITKNTQPRDEDVVGEPKRTGLGSPTAKLQKDVVPNEGVL
jgi:hypothetical protein